ncbi:hypothetical protein N5U20_09915 [Aliarcobacter butzleri]|uniref:hypothetical protein n=1 Tax=Aliarcobacter butzleri TaxID=28197 RepID=UPI00125FE71E|nr:hypothetical protein [Aliarcobacter butzleri]MCT7564624.1 hypothetical protein [Aliarcobacter butzleri]MCT7613522.1 hypothetical protein [Aliarcobacter butzleri]MCT7622621.1 hypothetical protein [Aliarcobacter butzleri]MCT7642103.1 hypothetical protein [Aliarcobacter butzleri]
MQKDLKDSIKARLYDFKYTPFLSSYIFSWIYFNSKLILIFTAPNLTVEKKIEMLSWSQINYKMPLYFALAYVFIFPIATAIFYAVTLLYKALMNWIQQKIQDKTPLPLEQAKGIREENIKLELEYKKVATELEKIKQEYSLKETNLTGQFAHKEAELEHRISVQVEEKTQQLNIDLRKAYNDITDKNTELSEKNTLISNLESQISQLKTEISNLKPITEEKPLIDKAYKTAIESEDSLLNSLTIEQIKVLATFFMYDSQLPKSIFKDYANNDFKLSKALIDLRITELSELALIQQDSNYFFITEKGQKIIEQLFN